MIRKENLGLAENIAVSLKPGVLIQPGDLLAGLNEESYGALPYTEHWRDQIGDVTANVTSHTELLAVGSTRMAEIIRGAFDMVKTYGAPLAKAVAKGVSMLYSSSDLNGISKTQITLRFINVNHPFFQSAVYPTQVTNKALSFTDVDLKVLSRLDFDYASNEDLSNFLKTSHPEIVPIIESKEFDLSSVLYNLFSLENLKYYFHEDGGSFDFSKIKTIEINWLLKAYLILAKMTLEDSPVQWLKKGTLDDYNEAVSLLYNGLTLYLINLKKLTGVYGARQLVIANNEPTTFGVYRPSEELDVALKVIKGDVTVYYTEDTIKSAEKAGVAIADVVVAKLYADLIGKDVGSIALLENKQLMEELLSEYRNNLHLTLESKAHDFFIDRGVTSTFKFLTEHPAALEAITALAENEDMLPLTFVRKAMEPHFDKLYYDFVKDQRSYIEQAGSVIENSDLDNTCVTTVLNSQLVPTFLRLLGCDLAAEILLLTFVKQEGKDTVSNQRERLHIALIQMLASKLLV